MPSKPPTATISFEELLQDEERVEKMISLFGYYLFWERHELFQRTEALLESSAERERLGRLFREPYENVAQLPADSRQASLQLAKHTVDAFVKRLLGLFGHTGTTLRLRDETGCVRFRIVMEICDAGDKPIVESTISQIGRKFFPEYFGNWLNTYSKSFDS